MIKYYKELENRNKYYLPLIDLDSDYNTEIQNFKLPISFYIKYKELFEYSKIFLIDYKMINDKMIMEKYKLGIMSYDDLNVFACMESLEEDVSSVYSFNEIDFSGSDCYFYFDYITKMLNIMMIVFKERKPYYEKIQNLFYSAMKEIDNFSVIEIKKSSRINVYLPDSWFITPHGYLYNSGGIYGHKSTSLIYEYGDLKNQISESISLEKIYNKRKIERMKINERRCITAFQFRNYLNYNCIFESLSKNKDGESHIPSIVNTVKGVVSAHEAFYLFFSNVQKYTNNPIEELKRLKKLTANDLVDILIRCCGLHKIETNVKNTVTTSSIYYEEEFSEYIERGWKIKFMPPLLVKRDIGIISELDMNSLFVQKVLEKSLYY